MDHFKLFSIDTKLAQEFDVIDDAASPRVKPGAMSSSSETATPGATPRTPRSSRFEDTTFFGSNFSLDALAEVALQHRPGIGKLPIECWALVKYLQKLGYFREVNFIIS